MLKIGTHICKVIAPNNGWFCVSSKGTEGIRLPLEIISGPCQDAQCEYVAWLSHSALKASIQTLAKVFGFDGNIATLANLVDTGPFVGKQCEITCEDEEYNGKKSVKIKWLNRVGSSGPAVLSAAAKAAMITKLNAECMAFAAEADDAPKPKASAPVDDGLLGDDIPF